MIAKVLLIVLCLYAALSAEVSHIRSAAQAYRKGETARQQKDFEAAIKFFQNAIVIEPTFTEAREGLIQTDITAGKKLEAALAITQLLQIEPDHLRERLTLAEILVEEHQPERALAQFATVLESNRNDADALLGFASTAYGLGMTDRAAEAVSRGRKLYPQDRRFEVLASTFPPRR